MLKYNTKGVLNMKRFLLAILLVVAALVSVNSVSAVVVWTGVNVPDPVGLAEEGVQPGVITLATYYSCPLPGGPCSYAVTGDSASLLDVDASTGDVDFLAPKDWFGIENVVFEVTDTSDSDIKQSNSVELNVANVNDAPEISSVPTLTANQGAVYTYDVNANDVDQNTLTWSLLIRPSGMTINANTGVITWTPTDAQIGNNNVNIKVTDGNGGNDAQSFTISVVDVNYAPAFGFVADDEKAQEERLVNLLLPSAVDPDTADQLTYDLIVVSQPSESTFSLTNNFDSATKVITWTPDKEDVGELSLEWRVTDSGTPTRSVYQEFTIEVYPKTMCETGEEGYAFEITDIKNPEGGDDFGPGDTIEIEVAVENSAGDDRDVLVEAVLYDLEQHKKVDDVESDDEEIEAGEDFSFKMELELPLDEDEDYKGDYVIYLKAYEDGKEDEQCTMDSVDVDIRRDRDRVIVKELTVTPYVVDSGETVDIVVDILSIGKDDQKEVYVKVKQSALGIDLKSDIISLSEYDEGGNTHSFRFTNVLMPAVEGGDYQLNVDVIYDGKTDKFTDSPTYVATAARNIITVRGPEYDVTLEKQELEKSTDNSYSVPITVSNDGDAGDFTISLEGVRDFAESVDDQTVYLGSGETKTIYFELVLSEDVEDEAVAFDAIVRSIAGKIQDRATFELDLEAVGEGWLSSKTFWIIGDIVLIVVAIFFLKLIFGGRKPEVQEVKL